jgi:bifunctional NMN adenylyltransferase/nudix hydrolase
MSHQQDILDSRRIQSSSITSVGTYSFPPIAEPKPFKFGFMLGRFQHIHIGHEHVINKALQMVDKLLILVGSAQESGTIRNPLVVESRIDLIREIYKNNPNVLIYHIEDLTHENDHSTAWGRYVLERVVNIADKNNIRINPDVMIYGNDEVRQGWFDPKDIEKISQIIINRGEVNISATELRKFMAEKNFYKWREYVNPAIHPKFNIIRDELLEIPFYKEMKPTWDTM